MANKYIILFVLSFFISSCGAARIVSLSPLEAHIPELHFSYLKGDAFIPVRGHGASFFKIGDKKIFKIKSHKALGKCTLVYQDGNTHKTLDCKGKSEIELDLGTYTSPNPDVVGFALTTEKAKTQIGYFYPNIRIIRESLPIEYKCPYQEDVGNTSICTRPSEYLFQYVIKIPVKGQLQVNEGCNGDSLKTSEFEVSASDLQLSLFQDKPNFCTIQVNFKGEGLSLQRNIFIRFYDPKYIPLSIPLITKTPKGYKVCATADYNYYSVNGVDYSNSFLNASCRDFTADILEVIALDEIGRLAWGSVSYKNNQVFYLEAIPYFKKKVESCKSQDCVIDTIESERLKYNVVNSVEKWDSQYLYE